MRAAPLLAALALAGCGSEAPGHLERAAAVRRGLYAIKATPGGPLARFDAVRLVGKDTLCGRVDGQDGGGYRAFSVAGGVATVAQPDDAALKATIDRACAGKPGYAVTSRNEGYTDIDVADVAT